MTMSADMSNNYTVFSTQKNELQDSSTHVLMQKEHNLCLLVRVSPLQHKQ